jgi:hypothetical protein
VEDVEKLMEDSAEAAAQQQRMHEALAETLTPEQNAAAARELAALEATAEGEEAAALDLPSVPQTTAAVRQPEAQAQQQQQAEQHSGRQLEQPIAAS